MSASLFHCDLAPHFSQACMNVFVLFGIGIEFLDKTCKTVCVCVRALV